MCLTLPSSCSARRSLCMRLYLRSYSFQVVALRTLCMESRYSLTAITNGKRPNDLASLFLPGLPFFPLTKGLLPLRLSVASKPSETTSAAGVLSFISPLLLTRFQPRNFQPTLDCCHFSLLSLLRKSSEDIGFPRVDRFDSLALLVLSIA